MSGSTAWRTYRFDRVESEISTIRNDIKTILLRLLPQAETG